MSKAVMLEKLEKAESAILENKDLTARGKWRQKYHFMPQVGWMNDPNGLIFFRGKYHFFYQHNPYSGFWRSMHWGHAVSDDMLHWEYLPLALAPSESYDDHEQGGCFSGSAIEYDGKLYLMYTGTCNDGNGFEQTQCIAYSEDGIHFEKYEGNPVITAPEGIPHHLFRDPKVWRHEDTFYAVVGASRDNMAQALLYRSDDMLHWTYFNVLAESRGEWGYMWECPDFYPLGDKYVLMVSPMGAKERTTVYMVGDFDYKTGRFFPVVTGELDWGHDFYAPQSFVAPDGRRIIVGWANCWDWMPFWKDWGPTYREGWCGSFNIPREVELMPDNTLSTKPIRELQKLRREPYARSDFELTGQTEIPISNGSVYEIKLTVDLTKTTAERLCLELRCNETKKTEVVIDFKRAEIICSRDQSDGWSRGRQHCPLNLIGREKLDVHICSDSCSLEFFSNHYQNNLSCNVFAAEDQTGNRMRAEGGIVSVEKLETWSLDENAHG